MPVFSKQAVGDRAALRHRQGSRGFDSSKHQLRRAGMRCEGACHPNCPQVLPVPYPVLSVLSCPPTVAIYSIWFYDKNDCQRIAQLMTRVVKQEALQAQQAPADSSAASRTNGCVDDRPVDILELLSKAKEEYQRGLVSESDASTNAQMEQNKEPLKPTTATMERGSAALQHDKNSHSGLKQITVEELFGSSLPKDPAPVTFPSETLEKGNPEGLHLSQNFVPSLPHDAALVPHLNTDPRGDHTLAKHNRLLAPGPASLSDTTGVPGYNLRPSPVFHTRGPGSSSPLLVTPRGSDPAVSSVRSTQCPPGSATYLPQDLLSQMKMDRLPTSALSKPGLTPSILPAGPQLATPECFREPILKPAAYSGSLPAPVQVVSMKAGSAASAVESSVLLSPSVFQNSVAKTQELERKPAAPSPSSSSLLATELPTPLSRHQLQDTLIHLIKTQDSNACASIGASDKQPQQQRTNIVFAHFLHFSRRSFMEDYHKPDQQTLQALRNIANRLRISSIKATTAAGSGHPTSCCSVAEIMSVLFFHTMRYRPEDPRNPNNDRFVLSKGHAAPVLYAVWAETGYLKESDLLNLRKIDSTLEGHPVPCPTNKQGLSLQKQQFVDVATGSLGQGLGAACGMAYTGKYFDKASYRVYCLLGDGELSEGAVWESMAFASYYQLDNLVAILDINRLGQSDPAPLQHHMEKYQRRCEAFGWNAIIVDGHSVEELCKVLGQPRHQPTAIIAKTVKGKGIPAAEDKMGWHGKPLPKDMADSVLKELNSRILNNNKRLYPPTPMDDAPPVSVRNIRMPSAPNYKPGEKIATRKAYGLALAKLGRYNERVVALDGDTKNSTFCEIFRNEHPNRYVECYIAEQNMVSVAVGCAARDRNIVFASTFATFFTRAFDQLRMAAISESNINLCGSHCGVSIGEDGPSQMGLEDIAMFRAIPTATVFYPSDGVSTEKAVELAANTKGICFIRTSRPENAIIYNCNEDFHVGQAKVVYKSNDDQITVIGAGVTLHEAVAAAEQLKKERINIRVIDPFTIKPLDAKTIIDNAKATRGRIITVEDHYYEGGLGEAVCSSVVNEPGFSVHRLAVAHVPRSGKPAELLKIFGIDKDAIIQAVKKMMGSSANAK
ncbi:transketolase-like [Scleropages formosus]|uniref:Transketolase n=1 Tax=Scleropages formosus TaxID=113540 RepID=A0A0P7V608_SCLFO|nr:transketolase-like [Scleropages formosus]